MSRSDPYTCWGLWDLLFQWSKSRLFKNPSLKLCHEMCMAAFPDCFQTVYYQIKAGPHRLINISFISGNSALIFSATKLQLCPSLKHITCGYLWKGKKKAGWVSDEERSGGLLRGSLGRVGWAIPCLSANTTTAATHSSLHSWCIFRQKQAYLPAV